MNSITYPFKHFIGYVAAALNLTNIGLTDTYSLRKLLLGNTSFDARQSHGIIDIVLKDKWNRGMLTSLKTPYTFYLGTKLFRN